ncbi:hypothetical protein GALL_235240 [mine drainage metagenome]|uniref:Uncharacterized protein n=1 Tax=mine drainage metagenome TaxID=410659 RepID=A0A1J5RGE3_9ZZZZ
MVYAPQSPGAGAASKFMSLRRRALASRQLGLRANARAGPQRASQPLKRLPSLCPSCAGRWRGFQIYVPQTPGAGVPPAWLARERSRGPSTGQSAAGAASKFMPLMRRALASRQLGLRANARAGPQRASQPLKRLPSLCPSCAGRWRPASLAYPHLPSDAQRASPAVPARSMR